MKKYLWLLLLVGICSSQSVINGYWTKYRKGAAPPAANIVLTLDINGAQSAGATTTVITKPTGVVDGDFMLAGLTCPDDQTITPPSGWTQLATYDFQTDYRLRLWYRRASSEGATYTWTTNAGVYTDGLIWRITGVLASGDPLDVAVGTATGDGTALSSPSITTVTNGAAVIQIGATSNDYTTLASTTLTERWDDGMTIFATGSIQASAGASGAKTGTLGTERAWGIIMLALKPQ